MGLLLHVFAGGLALVSGFIALFALKGGNLHRRGGLVFVCSMVVMALTGAVLAALDAALGNVIAGLLATYLVVTALTTVRPRTPTTRGLEAGGLVWAMVVGLGAVAVAIRSMTSGDVTPEAASLADVLRPLDRVGLVFSRAGEFDPGATPHSPPAGDSRSRSTAGDGVLALAAA